MKAYAKAISEELGLKEPNYESFTSVFRFIDDYKDKYNKERFNKVIPIRADYISSKKKGKNLCEKLAPLLKELYGKHGCYVLWEGSQIVYVGKSINLAERIQTSVMERNRQKKITAVTPIVTATEADTHILELVLISELKPILNSDTYCKDHSTNFFSNLSRKDLKEWRFIINKIKEKDKFEFLLFGGTNER